MPYDKETLEKTKEAKKGVRIDMLKSKGFSERDAIIKGSKESSVPADAEEDPDEEIVVENESYDSAGSYDEPLLVVEEAQLGSIPEIDSEVHIMATGRVVGINTKEDGTKCVQLRLSGISADSGGMQGMEEMPKMPKMMDEMES